MKVLKMMKVVMALFLIISLMQVSLTAKAVQSEEELIAGKLEVDIEVSGDEGTKGIVKKDSILFFGYSPETDVYSLFWDHKLYSVNKKYNDFIIQVKVDTLPLEEQAIGTINSEEGMEVLDETSKPFAVILPGQTYGVVGVAEDSYKVLIGNTEGLVKKNESIEYIPKELPDLKVVKSTETSTNSSNEQPSEPVDEPSDLTVENTKIEKQPDVSVSQDTDVTKGTGEFGNYFEATKEDLIVYSNKGGELSKIGKLVKGQTYPRIKDFGNWHQIKFSNELGYVLKEGTVPSSSSQTQNLNSIYKPTERVLTAVSEASVYDNSSGELVPFATIPEDGKIYLTSYYGNWYRVIVADRVGYVSKEDFHIDRKSVV